MHYENTLESINISSLNSRTIDIKQDNILITDAYKIQEQNCNIKKLVDDWILFDYSTIDNLTYEHTGNNKQWIPVILQNFETWRLLFDENKNIIGYWHVVPIFDKYFNQILEGNLLDSELTIDKIPLLIPGTYNFYIVGVALESKYRDGNTIKILMNSMYEAFENLLDQCVYVKNICALAYSDDGLKLCRNMGLKVVREHCNHGTILNGTIKDFLNPKYVKTFKTLCDFYC
jgi:hypothetical protein